MHNTTENSSESDCLEDRPKREITSTSPDNHHSSDSLMSTGGGGTEDVLSYLS